MTAVRRGRQRRWSRRGPPRPRPRRGVVAVVGPADRHLRARRGLPARAPQRPARRPAPTSPWSPAAAWSAVARWPWWPTSSASSPARSGVTPRAASPPPYAAPPPRACRCWRPRPPAAPACRRARPPSSRWSRSPEPIGDHKAAGLPYLVHLRHPTTGGVYASWGSLGHVTVAEPGALVGFLGPKVYEALNGDPFPAGVQQAENLAAKGVIDAVVAAEQLPELVDRSLRVLLDPAEPPSLPRRDPTALTPRHGLGVGRDHPTARTRRRARPAAARRRPTRCACAAPTRASATRPSSSPSPASTASPACWSARTATGRAPAGPWARRRCARPAAR